MRFPCIAADANYINSVNSYNNCFTRFFAWVSRKSMTVNFDGNVRSINKRSYLKLVRNLTNEDVKLKNIRKYSIFRDVAEKGKLPKNNKKMRDAISDSDRQSLFRKLAVAISEGKTDRALKMIGKGAALDTFYYEREGKGPRFYSDTGYLSSEKRYEFTVFKGTPVLVAARKANTAVVQRLKEYGANTSLKGKSYLFKREITHVTKEPEIVSGTRVVKLSNGTFEEVDTERIEERIVVHTEDSRINDKYYRLDESLRLVLA